MTILPDEQSFFITTFKTVTLLKEVKLIFIDTSSFEGIRVPQGKSRQNICGSLGTTPWFEMFKETWLTGCILLSLVTIEYLIYSRQVTGSWFDQIGKEVVGKHITALESGFSHTKQSSCMCDGTGTTKCCATSLMLPSLTYANSATRPEKY